MTMIEAGADAIGSAGDAASSAGKKFGLTGSQKAAAVGSALPQPRTHHPYLVGLILITVGGFMLIGSITGTLPSMLAALFVPAALTDDSGGTIADVSNINHLILTEPKNYKAIEAAIKKAA